MSECMIVNACVVVNNYACVVVNNCVVVSV